MTQVQNHFDITQFNTMEELKTAERMLRNELTDVQEDINGAVGSIVLRLFREDEVRVED